MTPRAHDVQPAEPGNETILILSPTGNDAVLAAHVLAEAGFETAISSDLLQLCDSLLRQPNPFHAGAILMAEEALLVGQDKMLTDVLDAQPAWSDLPIVLLTSGEESRQANLQSLDLFESSGNVTLLERPLHAITLVSTLRAALRSRRRQYEIRDLLEQRESALATISAAREEAEGANRMKDEFLATLSHELRTPLNAILGWGHILREEMIRKPGEADLETFAQGVEVIERNARVQAQLIEDLLDVSRIISGKLLLDYKPVDPAKVLIAARDSVAPQAEIKGVALEMSIGPHLPPIWGDAARLQQIVWNLLSNAVKFTPSGGQIQLRLTHEDDVVKIVVRDTGQGIAPEFLPFVFERFRQADATTTRRQGGLGLGLSIVRQLVDLQHGSVSVESAGTGRGTTFTLRFPVADGSAGIAGSHNGSCTHAPRRGNNLDGVRILVVDNEADARDLLKRLLMESHAEVEAAASVSEAMRMIENSPPDILVSDIGMPEEDGYDLIRKVRESIGSVRSIPAIAVTAYASAEDKSRAKLAGFQAHLTKPIDPFELRATIESLLSPTSTHGTESNLSYGHSPSRWPA